MIRRLFSSALPRSSNPVIIRLLEDSPVRAKMARGPLVYPRRRLVFDIDGLARSIFVDRSRDSPDLSAYAWAPPAVYATMLAMRFDIYSPLNCAGLAAVAGSCYFFWKQQQSARKKCVYHLLVTKDFEQLYLGMKDSREGVEVFGALHGLCYRRVAFEVDLDAVSDVEVAGFADVLDAVD